MKSNAAMLNDAAGLRHYDDVKALVDRNEKLEALYKEVAGLTLNHGVIGDTAAVTAMDLGNALDKVNPDWYKDVE
jgi:hypothetical protein